MCALALLLLTTRARAQRLPHPLMTAPESQLLIEFGKGTAGEDSVNTQQVQARTSNKNLLVTPSTYPCTCASVHAPAQGESYGSVLVIKIFSTNVGHDFQK